MRCLLVLPALIGLVAFTTGCPADCLDPNSIEYCAPDYYDLDLRIQTPPPLEAPAGTVVTGPIEFLVVTNFSNRPHLPVGHVTVEFEVIGGGGTVPGGTSATLASAITDGNGIARLANWTMGAFPGQNRLRVRIVSFDVQGTRVETVSNSPRELVVDGTARAAAGITLFGSGQTGAVGTALAPLKVQVWDATGPVAGAPVAFVPGPGSGSVSVASATTDVNGEALVTWTLGTGAGPQSVQVTGGGHPGVFTATAVAGAPNRMVKVVNTDSFTVAPGQPVPTAPEVRIVDQYGNGVTGVSVSFTATAGGGTISSAPVNTGPNGNARAGTWTLGSTPGTYQVQALATAGGPPIADNGLFFTAFAVTPFGPPVAMAKFEGDNQTAKVGTVLTLLPAVRITDAQGRPVPGVTITYTVGTGSGTISGATPQTDLNGVARLGGWTLGNFSGTQYLLVNTPAASAIVPNATSFQLTATPDTPTAMIKFLGDNRVVIAGATINGTGAPTVRVQDQFGNGIQGIQITFATTTVGSTVTGAIQTTNSNGTATVGGWTTSTAAGQNILTATAALPTGVTITGNPATFTATGNPNLGVSQPVARGPDR